MDKISVYRVEHFNASHRLHNDNWTDERNKEVFGKCNNENYHGHNYKLVLRVTGEINPDTGYAIDMKWLSDLMKEEIVERFNFKNLNKDVYELKGKNPTAENIAIAIYDILVSKIAKKYRIQVILYETKNNYVKYPSL